VDRSARSLSGVSLNERTRAQALHKPTNHIFALKCIPKIGNDDDDAIFNEMAMMQVCGCANIATACC
jgi:hypothetical protein